ncbi:MAG: pyrroloquinoline quinone precursor peptide PqqA [Deltaproteobacteria bacterium]|nr:pyrroloquinoline quinone precursor peptide PqqA [Deltaproteobacteria bacterium]
MARIDRRLTAQVRLWSISNQEKPMVWSKPTFVELRFGFEVTMYIWNR